MPFVVAEFDPREISFFHHDRAFRCFDPPPAATSSVYPGLELQRLLREQPKLIDTFVEEALRLESPFRQQMRSIPHDTTLGGVDIPEGSTAVLLFGSANRDPDQFDNPDVVDLTRGSPRRHLAFGHGIHYCVGAALARIEARSVLTTLLERTREFTLD